jgi:hypothetical protein
MERARGSAVSCVLDGRAGNGIGVRAGGPPTRQCCVVVNVDGISGGFLAMYTPCFSELWDYHPASQDPPVINPCERSPGVATYDNQCAIRMSTCLDACGVSLASYHGLVCPIKGHGRTHVRSAEGLAAWLNGSQGPFGKATIVKNNNQRNAIASQQYGQRQGIVLFRNFWGTGLQGDHIDLWDGTAMTHGSPYYFSRSQEVWFWDVW